MSENEVPIETQAIQFRKQLIVDILSEKTSVREVCEFSKLDRGDNQEAKWASRLKLVDILRNKPGWDAKESKLALARAGFKVTDTIRTIRNKSEKFRAFRDLMSLPREALTLSKGRKLIETNDWPWRGKLKTYAQELGITVAELLGDAEGTENAVIPSEEDSDDLLDDILGDDEEESDEDLLDGILND